MLNNLFEIYEKEFKIKEQLFDSFSGNSVGVKTRIVTSYGRLGFIINLTNPEPLVAMMDYIMEQGFSVLPTISTLGSSAKINMPKSHLFGIIDELPNNMTKQNTIFIRPIQSTGTHGSVSYTEYRIEFYPLNKEIQLDKLLDPSTSLYISYCISEISNNLSEHIVALNNAINPFIINRLLQKENDMHLYIDATLPEKEFFYDIYKSKAGKVGINFTCYLQNDWYFVDLANLTSDSTITFNTYGKSMNYYVNNSNDSFVILEVSMAEYYTYNTLAWDSYKYVSIHDRYLMTYLNRNYNTIEEKLKILEEMAEKLSRSSSVNFYITDSIGRLRYRKYLFSTDIFLLWIRSDKSSKIKDLTFNMLWSDTELQKIGVVTGDISGRCEICSKYTWYKSENTYICSKRCLDRYRYKVASF